MTSRLMGCIKYDKIAKNVNLGSNIASQASKSDPGYDWRGLSQAQLEIWKATKLAQQIRMALVSMLEYVLCTTNNLHISQNQTWNHYLVT